MNASVSAQSPNGATRFKSNGSRAPSRLSMISKPTSVSKSLDGEPRSAVNVVPAIRVRPLPSSRDPAFESIPARFRNSRCQAPNSSTLAIESTQGRKQFTFDRVFPDTEAQQGVWEHVSDGINAFVQGYNVSLIAYGQTGAGKSYTMGTTSPTEQRGDAEMGIIPRAAVALFKNLSGTCSSRLPDWGSGPQSPPRGVPTGAPPASTVSRGDDKTWQLKATYVEIYNEQLRDLLVPESVPETDRTAVNIREDTKGRIVMTGAKQVVLNSIEDMLSALEFGSSIRQTESASNSRSSRSHAIFSMNLVQRLSSPSAGATEQGSNENHMTIDSKLHFVDLAGSERLKSTGLSGEKVKEGMVINTGLASLGKVISQLASRAPGSHVSYRDSRLTRLLQDSLGGSAITYMIACVNPMEFHLSETLSTAQYAQRARTIQTTPRIQQRTQESERQLIIDRLRSEVAYLRDQLRISEQIERRSNNQSDRTGRKQARENELQNQLLDAQENYGALSQRHAKLISELAKNKDERDVQSFPAIKRAMGTRSRDSVDTFAETVEQVILEYEKTIQSLECSLSNTRSSLSTSESGLLEREAKVVYMEAVTQQLQARIQRSNERETTNEAYLRELEARLEGIDNGEDQNLEMIRNLRDELTRARESETSAEDYIATLEERLAEAEQDTDLMQREISRLEQVVQRQRSLAKTESLSRLPDSARHENASGVNGVTSPVYQDADIDMFHDRLIATTSGIHPNEELAAETAEAEWKSFGPMEGDDDNATQYTAETDAHQGVNGHANHQRMPSTQTISAAQSRAVADKLETVTMELFDLRVEHESTTAELDEVSHKYQMALRTLAELQDAVDEARQTRTPSFLANGAMHETKEDGTRLPSRLYFSELSSLGESPTLIEGSDADTSTSDRGDHRVVSRVMQKEETLAEAIRSLKRANAEKDISISELTENYAQLQDQHNDTLNYIEELKEEVQKAQSLGFDVGHSKVNESQDTGTFEQSSMLPSALFNATPKNHGQRASDSEPEKAKHLEEVAALQKQLATQNKKFAQLEQSYTQLMDEMDQDTGTRGLPANGFRGYRETIMDLEDQVDQQKSLVVFHQQGMKSMEETHAKDLAELKTAHERKISALTKVESSRTQDNDASSSVQRQIQALEHERNVLSGKHKETSKALATAESQMRDANHMRRDLEMRVEELTAMNEETLRQLELSLQNERRSSTLVLDLEHQLGSNRSGSKAPRERYGVDDELDQYRSRIAFLESQLADMKRISNRSDHDRSPAHVSTLLRHPSASPIPSSPPAIPLPPLPTSYQSHHQQQQMDDYETRIRTIEKHLYAEKQLTQTLEEALVDLEAQNNKTRTETDAWKRKCRDLEEEASGLRRERGTMRNSLQAVEEERDRRIRAEQARRQLEERMENLGKKGKKGKGLNCF